MFDIDVMSETQCKRVYIEIYIKRGGDNMTLEGLLILADLTRIIDERW